MPSPFARSLRSIESDKFDISIITTAVAIILIVCWSLWFFFSTITLYTESRTLRLRGDGYIETVLPNTQMRNVKQGQPAVIILDGEAGEEMGVISAYIYQFQQNDTETTITLYSQSHSGLLNNLQTAPTGLVRIQVETSSPMALILKALGQSSNTPSVVSGPQG